MEGVLIMNALPKQKSLKITDLRAEQAILSQTARSQAGAQRNEQMIFITRDEMTSYREYLLQSVKPLGACTLKDALNVVFEKTLDYFIAFTSQSVLNGLVILQPENGIALDEMLKEQNRAIMQEIFMAVRIVDLYEWDYRQIIYDYFDMVKSVLCLLSANVRNEKAVWIEARMAWNDFCRNFDIDY